LDALVRLHPSLAHHVNFLVATIAPQAHVSMVEPARMATVPSIADVLEQGTLTAFAQHQLKDLTSALHLLARMAEDARITTVPSAAVVTEQDSQGKHAQYP
jgi:hypothetical protein